MAAVPIEVFRDKRMEPTPQTVLVAANTVERGGLIVFPWGDWERKCLAFMADANNIEACRRMNAIKTRDPNKVLAVNGNPDVIARVAKIEESKPLTKISQRLQVEPEEVLRRMMTTGAVSFIFEARDGLPDTVTNLLPDGRRSVMVAGEIEKGQFDFYNNLLDELSRRGVVTAGSSANRTEEGTWHVFEQDAAYVDIAEEIDLFVFHGSLPDKRLSYLNLESCTSFDMMGTGAGMTAESDIPYVYRRGSVHPWRFSGILGGFKTPAGVKSLPHRERFLQMPLKKVLNLIDK